MTESDVSLTTEVESTASEPKAGPTGEVAAAPGPVVAEALPAESPPGAAEPAVNAAAKPIDVAEIGQRLKELFPALFKGQLRPLKLRIQTDIQQRAPGAFSKQALSAFFRRHTSGTGYLIAVSKAPHRFDLDGQPAGEVADEHRRIALEELSRRRANREQREELAEQQRRNRHTLLRDFERTTLTRANFCVLKGVAEAEVDGLLEMARQEMRESRPTAPLPARADLIARRPSGPTDRPRRR